MLGNVLNNLGQKGTPAVFVQLSNFRLLLYLYVPTLPTGANCQRKMKYKRLLAWKREQAIQSNPSLNVVTGDGMSLV